MDTFRETRNTLGVTIHDWLVNIGFEENSAIILKGAIIVLGLFILSYIVLFIAKKIIVKVLHEIAKRTENTWDDIMVERGVFHRLAYVAPAILIHELMPNMLKDYSTWIVILQAALEIYMVLIVIMVLDAFFNALIDIYQNYEISKFKPIKGYIQIMKIIIYLISGIIIISILINKSPIYLLTGLGAISAVLMLIFKDTLLGFVASIQLSSNDMLRPGDWITINKFGADGTVMDINLTTVKIENFDKTITTVPTYSLISDAFQNWRGMQESGVRRIKRSIIINMNSVKFCTPEMLDSFSKITLISNYIKETQLSLKEFNESNNVDHDTIINGKRQTNLGIFRAYFQAYLNNNEYLSKENTLIVRQLQPTERGLPIEIYAFSTILEWEKYEDLISDIFDHILAVIPHFELQIFQNPSGSDFKSLVNVQI
ncbi:MAG: mechanosensitive ion channel [Bacteroidetes bacterium]|nr:mechanosensitive ion channel [Bacteroidota bacterium]